jgi:multidrug transporter EmrE-like cation transporter
MRAWIALFSAIACEVMGTLALKLFGGTTRIGFRCTLRLQKPLAYEERQDAAR